MISAGTMQQMIVSMAIMVLTYSLRLVMIF